MDKEKLGRFISLKRRELQLTQKQLAEKLHVTDKAVSKWERGLSFPDIMLLEPLSQALKIPLENLISCEDKNVKDTKEIVSETLIISKSAVSKAKIKYLVTGIIIPIITALLCVYSIVTGFYKSIDAALVYFEDSNSIVSKVEVGNLRYSSTETLWSAKGPFEKADFNVKGLCGSEKISDIEISENNELQVSQKIKRGKAKLLIVDEKNNACYFKEIKEEMENIKLPKGRYSVFAVGYWYWGKISIEIV